ncbi:MAG: Adaptive-response sensory-kinase SasA [Elusimicrobia bacterium]|nr:Adaptive-response sensory-kinase SasA [Elusimicrobiota bacterium]
MKIEVPALDQKNQIAFSLFPEFLGRLRRELAWSIGESRANGVLTRAGLSCGQSVAMKNSEPLSAHRDLGEFVEISDPNSEKFIFELKNSIEASEYLRYFHAGKSRCQCWFISGYLAGYNSWKNGVPLYFLETHCLTKGDTTCRFMGQPRMEWNKDGHKDLSVYEENDMALELLNTHQQLHLTKDRYQNLFEQSNLPIFISDPNSGIIFNVNQAAVELTGHSKDQLLKMTLFDLCHPQEHNQLMNDFKSLMNGNTLSEREMSILRKNGLIRSTAHSGKILTYGGQIVVQSIMRDITDLKLSNQKEKDLYHQLVRSERLSSIGRLAAGVAHELKNPLGAIRNAIYYIQNALKGNPLLETDPHLKTIIKLAESEVDSSVVIIGELLDYSHVVQLVPRKTHLNDVLENLPNIIKIPENISLIWDLDVRLPSAMVDPDRLNQVFCNISSNAIQAMPKGGTLTIKSGFVIETTQMDKPNQEFIDISFEDTGAGIDPSHLVKIFEPLFTTKTTGTGLGLAISRNIVEKHGGQILVTSQVGKGTNFTIRLPLKIETNMEE